MNAPNDGKQLTISVSGVEYQRIPIKTHTVMPDDDLSTLVTTYASPLLEDGDILFVTEKIVAIIQGRSYSLDEIQPRKLAVFLSKYVTKTSYGIGLGIPETMEMALRECGTPRILFAAGIAAVTKLFGRKGDFYRIAGDLARGIDGPTQGTLPPYNQRVVLVPVDPDGVSRSIERAVGKRVTVMIVDINDFGGNVLGSNSDKAHERLVAEILSDNPLGQGHESTPMGIIRPVPVSA